jgi:drug/metabolite transporter (DMT)-like permease
VLGIVLLLVAQCFTGTQFIVEEKILGNYVLNPMYIVGWEGFFGCVYYLITLPILQFIKCTPSSDFCVFGVIEDTQAAFQQMGNNGLVLACCIGTIFTIASFNYFGVATTKYASAPQRSTVDTSRTVLIWIFFLSVPINGKTEEFKWLQLIGFILLIFGTLVYNEILVIPILGFDQWTKAAIAKREEENGENKRKNSLKDTL